MSLWILRGFCWDFLEIPFKGNFEWVFFLIFIKTIFKSSGIFKLFKKKSNFSLQTALSFYNKNSQNK